MIIDVLSLTRSLVQFFCQLLHKAKYPETISLYSIRFGGWWYSFHTYACLYIYIYISMYLHYVRDKYRCHKMKINSNPLLSRYVYKYINLFVFFSHVPNAECEFDLESIKINKWCPAVFYSVEPKVMSNRVKSYHFSHSHAIHFM